jgi:CheY-like chemotaxis protein
MLSLAPQLSLRRGLLSCSHTSSSRRFTGRSVRHTAARSSGSAVGPSADAASYRVLAFEDSYNIKSMLVDAKVRFAHFEQRWTSHSPIEALEEFGQVDVLLLDYYLPPMTGFKVRSCTS